MRCPIDESTLEERRCGSATYGACPACRGTWVPASTVRALLAGEAKLSREVLAAATPAVPSIAIHHAPSFDGSGPETGVRRTLPRRYHCSDCGALLQMPDPVTHSSPCTRCGAVWIQSEYEAAIGAWYRRTMQAAAMAMLQASGASPSLARATSEDAAARRAAMLLVASVAFFVLFSPFGTGGVNVRHFLSGALGLAGAGLVAHGLRRSSRYELGALTRSGFAYALAGAALVVAAVLSWR